MLHPHSAVNHVYPHGGQRANLTNPQGMNRTPVIPPGPETIKSPYGPARWPPLGPTLRIPPGFANTALKGATMQQAMPLHHALSPHKLPTPKVQTAHVQQPVDLKPAGNTVALTTSADNPFTAGAPIQVHTQASGGGYPAPQSMQSRAIMHSYIPGMGENNNAANQGLPAVSSQPGIPSQLITAGQDILSVFRSREEAKAAAAQAEAEAARAQAAGDQARAVEARGRADAILAAIGAGRTAPNWTTMLLIGGVGLLGVAMFMGGGGFKRRAPARRRPARRRTRRRR